MTFPFPFPTLEMLTGFQRHRLALLVSVILRVQWAEGNNRQLVPRERCPLGMEGGGARERCPLARMEAGGTREPLCCLQPLPGLQVCLVPGRAPCLDLLKSWGLSSFSCVRFLQPHLGLKTRRTLAPFSSIPACFHVADPS